MTAIAWAIICAALLYVDTEYVKLFGKFNYENSNFIGGCFTISLGIFIICTVRELFR